MRRFRVAVFYIHPLFGLGITRLLAEDPALEVACLPGAVADGPSVAANLSFDAVVLEDWGNPALTGRFIQALPSALVAVVRLRDNTMDVYRGRRRIRPLANNLVELLHELPARNVETGHAERQAVRSRSAS